MPDKKLTDNEIIKALECCISNKTCEEAKCPLYENGCEIDIQIPHRFALDLINRLQAENEWLRNCNYGNLESINKLVEKLKTAKAEAYKECIEKVEEIICDNTYPDFDINHKAVNIWKPEAYKNIRNLLKELVGENNESKNK